MKHLITKDTYKGTNVELYISPDFSEIKAWSWNWWQFVDKDKNGNIVFQDHSYSSSTRRHQSRVRDILDRLGLTIGLTVCQTAQGLQGGIEVCIQSEIDELNDQIEKLDRLRNTKGTHKRKNHERAIEMKYLSYRVKDLERYLSTGQLPSEVDWRRYGFWELVRAENGTETDMDLEQWELEQLAEEKQRHETWKKYFLKPNGKLKENEYKAFMKGLKDNYRRTAPESIEGIKALFGLKGLQDIMPVLNYEYSGDLNNMIPAEGSTEELKLKRFIDKNMAHGVTTHLLDKCHTFLINAATRKTYTPREQELLPLHPAIEKLKGLDGVSVIDTVQRLRLEGKRQSHCIGGKHYIDLCKRGYQALNYKGYTFFLDNALSLRETKGRHNSPTPNSIVEELSELLSETPMENVISIHRKKA